MINYIVLIMRLILSNRVVMTDESDMSVDLIEVVASEKLAYFFFYSDVQSECIAC